MRIVLDTNILVSALITKGSPPDQLYQAWLRSEIELVTSDAQIDEVIDVLARPRLRRCVDSDEAAQMVAAARDCTHRGPSEPEVSGPEGRPHSCCGSRW